MCQCLYVYLCEYSYINVHAGLCVCVYMYVSFEGAIKNQEHLKIVD